MSMNEIIEYTKQQEEVDRNAKRLEIAIISGGRNAGRTIQQQMELLARMDELEQYRAIGTIEEFKALKEDGRFLEFLYNNIPPNEMEQYLSMYQIKDKVAVNGYADQCGLMPAT